MMAELKTMSTHKAVASWMWIFDFGSYVPWWAPTNIVTASFWHSWRYQIILDADLVKLFANPSTELSICSICNNRQQELAGTLGCWKWLGMICQELGGTTIIWIGALCFLRHTLDCENLWKGHTQLQQAKIEDLYQQFNRKQMDVESISQFYCSMTQRLTKLWVKLEWTWTWP